MNENWTRWEGQTIKGPAGDFPLRKYLGGSEHSAVYLTERAAAPAQKAVMKLIPAEGNNAEAQMNRWKAARKLEHPHLVRLFEMGACRLGETELLFVVMEYAEEDISQVLPERPLTWMEAQEMLKPALETLTWLHRQGFVHARLKPANIMAVADQLKLSSDGILQKGQLDFGGRGSGLYDAPEQASEPVTPAIDSWALGVSVAEILTQKKPVSKATEHEDPAVSPNLPAPYFDIVRQCLRREPRRRWTIAEVSARLQPVLFTPTKPERSQAGSIPNRRRLMIPAIAASVVIAAILGGWRLISNIATDGQSAGVVKPEPQPPESGSASRASGPGNGTEAAPGSAKNTSLIASSVRPSPAHRTGTRVSAPLPAAVSPAASSSTMQPAITRSEAAPATLTSHPVSSPAGVVHEVLPSVPQKALDTIRGTIRVSVRVQVDASGNVTGAEFYSPGSSHYFAKMAMDAAQGWKFSPAAGASRSILLHFDFTNTDVKAYSAGG